MRGEHVVSVNENRGNVRDLALRLVVITARCVLECVCVCPRLNTVRYWYPYATETRDRVGPRLNRTRPITTWRFAL